MTTASPNLLYVSIQDRDATDPVAAHLAPALLAGPSLVLVPDPPPGLLDTARDLVVKIFTAYPGSVRPVETLLPWCMKRVHIGAHDVAIAIDLATPSRYLPTIRQYNKLDLVAQLQTNGGSLWRAFQALRAIDPATVAGPSPALLARLPDLEREQRRYAIRDRAAVDLGEAGDILCVILCICDPG